MQAGSVRIIGGKWRGRRLKVPSIEGLRPTPDRVRETIFNWLAPYIAGANCLDLFAGSGVLGFEAISRGAARVVLVDYSQKVIDLINEELLAFKADNASVYCAEIPSQLKLAGKPFDIVFIDPPYQQDLLPPCCRYLEDNAFLAENALIYLEARQGISDNDLPENWHVLKSKRAGQVAYHLIQRDTDHDNYK